MLEGSTDFTTALEAAKSPTLVPGSASLAELRGKRLQRETRLFFHRFETFWIVRPAG